MLNLSHKICKYQAVFYDCDCVLGNFYRIDGWEAKNEVLLKLTNILRSCIVRVLNVSMTCSALSCCVRARSCVLY